VPLPAGAIDAGSLEAIRTAFATVYTPATTSLYGGAEIEAINFRVPLPGPDPDPVAGRRHRRRRRCGQGARAHGWHASPTARSRPWSMTATPWCRATGSKARRSSRSGIDHHRAAGDIVRVDETLNLRIAIGVAAPVQALVTAEMTLPEAMARIEADPIALEIMWEPAGHRGRGDVADRLPHRLLAGDLEAQDFACELLTPTARPWPIRPGDAGVQPDPARAVKALLAEYPAETLQPATC